MAAFSPLESFAPFYYNELLAKVRNLSFDTLRVNGLRLK